MVDEVVRGSLPPPGFYSLSGMEQARAFLRGLVPSTPLVRLIGHRPTQMGSGSATLTMPASPWLQFGDGSIDIKILMEEALGVAVLTGAPPGARIVTTAMSVNHFRPSTLESEAFVARARVLNSGSAFTVAEVLVEDALGRAVAHATASLTLRAIEPPPPPHAGFAPVDDPSYATADPHLRPAPSEGFLFGGMSALQGMQMLVAGESSTRTATGSRWDRRPRSCASGGDLARRGFRNPTAYSRPCCSPTSSPPRDAPRSSATKGGARCSPSTMPWSAAGSRRSSAARSRRPAMASSRRSSPRREPCSVRAIRDGVGELGLEVRAGIHTGECERVGGDLAGIAVHAASRIVGLAAAGEILVSSTVHDLVAGSGIVFADRGLHELKDIEGSRQLFAVSG